MCTAPRSRPTIGTADIGLACANVQAEDAWVLATAAPQAPSRGGERRLLYQPWLRSSLNPNGMTVTEATQDGIETARQLSGIIRHWCTAHGPRKPPSRGRLFGVVPTVRECADGVPLAEARPAQGPPPPHSPWVMPEDAAGWILWSIYMEATQDSEQRCRSGEKATTGRCEVQ